MAKSDNPSKGKPATETRPLREWIERGAYLGPKDPPREPTANQVIKPPEAIQNENGASGEK